MPHFDLQLLETRRLFAGILLVSQQVSPTPPAGPSLQAGTTATLLRGELKGHYFAEDESTPLGLTLKIKRHTQSNHVRGTVTFKTSSGNIVADFTGHMSHTRHLSITIIGDHFTGSMIATVSHTGGLIKGTYEVSGTFGSVGTFRVSKA